MKKSSVFFAILLSSMLGTHVADAALIAYWNFNGLSITTASVPGVGGVPTTIAADQGAGSIDLGGWGGTVDDFAGATNNALSSDPGEESLSLISSGPTAGPYPGNGSFITISFSMVGLENPAVTFATRGTATGFTSGNWSWSIDGTNFTPLPGSVNTASTSANFAVTGVDFSSINELDGATTAYLRYTLSGATSNSGNNRIDNLQINTVPEPASALLGALGLLGILRRRR